MKNQKGFSLIELLIVVVIIGIIAAIAIPNLLAARRSANEGSAISSIRTVHGAQMTFQGSTGGGQYAPNLTALGAASMIDDVLVTGTKSGYQFSTSAVASGTGTPATFSVASQPVTGSGVTATGTRLFACLTDGVIYSAPVGTTLTINLALTSITGGQPLNN